ncbi:Myc-type basic helix-loop-helix (bHLH) domain-containing protein [Dioscorea alata]|uniref:Myc-type basic helix-loop-helix (BHLH) domain-containing protein n=1 Tax=Dioscorea alata TaxID=55571 RepID=A0ACB7WV39_DIOAL|nr:Myc-type basic helix-loop-helix (bHLH) domain-containing protein [Dioscorea alata]
MDRWTSLHCSPETSCPDSSSKVQQEVKDSMAVRKGQKADREKLRRERLNEQFFELGKVLDPERPKNDKATVLSDAIQMLKDLTAQVDRLKAEYMTLSEESKELTQEKNELREEKAKIKSDIENLNAQYQQRLRVMFPWGAMDHSVIMGHPPSYPFPVPVPIASGPIAIHPSMPPYHYFRGPNPGAYPAYTPYSTTSNHQGDQPSNQQNNPNPPPSSEQSHDTSEKDCGSKLSDNHTQSGAERREDFSDVPTELELKTPGSTAPSSLSQVAHDQELSSEGREGTKLPRRKKCVSSEVSTPSSCSSSCDLPESSSYSVGDGSVANQ